MRPSDLMAAPGERARNRGRAIGAAAAVVMLGNLTSSVLGFARQATILHVFHYSARTDAFFAASLVPQMFYDLTIGAAISAALIPTFTEIGEKRGVGALSQVVGAVLALLWIVLGPLVILLSIGARWLMYLLLWSNLGHPRPGAFAASVGIARILVVTLLFLGTSAVLLSALYAVRRFTVAAFASGFYHLGIIAGAALLARPLGILALPIGAVAGSAAQALVQVPSLLRAGIRPRLRLELSPDVRRILRLYAPVAAGLLVSLAGQIIDIGFKWQLGKDAVSAMASATMLTQFPIGIVVAALSFAILPSISSDVAFARLEDFKRTLTQGMRLSLFLTLPALLGFALLATPVIAMLYASLSRHEVSLTAQALIGYSLQIPAVGIDQLLIFSFYARRDTRTPMIVGVIGVGIYLVAALLLAPRLHILGLALANTLQNSLHAVILFAIMLRAIGGLGGLGISRSVLKTAACGVVMGVAAVACVSLLGGPWGGSLVHRLALGLVPLATGGLVYLACAAVLRSEELAALLSVARSRLAYR